ncbi:sugar phosphate isomerase/epimerase family protein [Rhizobium sp. NFR03]|uniref:sugar phosphate isomerase/epimerase family protein n=1 Tax=Rhizobium sp. NFR03 TaxID=1566263 RepID=UPI0008B83A4D|nr:sugar phosphate isomerase/epimerase family protein [Rhizobium sp. NFR03]SES27455.1 Sugar phosphate isomerase/epimerase [Rhizobium sp. NFR03]
MKLGLSNLAFEQEPTVSELEALAAIGFTGIEVAPTRIAPWSELTDQRLADYAGNLARFGLSASSLQAIFFGAEGVELLSEPSAFERMRMHIHLVGRVGQALGARTAVFGAPRQRRRGALSVAEAFDLGRERLGALAQVAAQYGLVLGLEPVPQSYGCDFLDRWTEMREMVDAVSHPGLGIHLDTSCVELSGDSIIEAIHGCAGKIVHFHAAEPDLRGFDMPVADHPGAAATLRAQGYDGWVVVEMLAAKAGGPDAFATAARYVNRVYGDTALSGQS